MLARQARHRLTGSPIGARLESSITPTTLATSRDQNGIAVVQKIAKLLLRILIDDGRSDRDRDV